MYRGKELTCEDVSRTVSIPAVSAWGMIARTLLVLTVGATVFMRKRQVAPRAGFC